MCGPILDPETPEPTACRDGTHLVIQLRPAHASAAVAETDEFGRVRVGDSRGGVAWLHRWRTLPPAGMSTPSGIVPRARPTTAIRSQRRPRRCVGDRRPTVTLRGRSRFPRVAATGVATS